MSLTDAERHELECLRAQVKQLDYPCSPHCAGYLRELEIRNRASTHPSNVENELRAWANYNKSPPGAGSNTRQIWPEILLDYLDGKKPQKIMEAVEFHRVNAKTHPSNGDATLTVEPGLAEALANRQAWKGLEK